MLIRSGEERLSQSQYEQAHANDGILLDTLWRYSNFSIASHCDQFCAASSLIIRVFLDGEVCAKSHVREVSAGV
jgi:hypothetical protein